MPQEQPIVPEVHDLIFEVTELDKPLILSIGLQFMPMQITADSWGYVPQLLWCNNAITGETYDRDTATMLIPPESLARAIEGLKWAAWFDDDVDEALRNEIFEVAGEYPGTEDKLPLG